MFNQSGPAQVAESRLALPTMDARHHFVLHRSVGCRVRSTASYAANHDRLITLGVKCLALTGFVAVFQDGFQATEGAFFYLASHSTIPAHGLQISALDWHDHPRSAFESCFPYWQL